IPSVFKYQRYSTVKGACPESPSTPISGPWHDARAAGRPVSREGGFARSTGPRHRVAGLAASARSKGELVRHRVRSLTTSMAFAVSLITLAAAPGAHAGAGPATGASWPQYQGNAAHTGLNTKETTLDTGNVADLQLSWVGQVPGQLDWASPVVTGD